MHMMQGKCAMHLPRILLSLVFIVGGYGFLANFNKTIAFVATGLENIWLPTSFATAALVIAIVLKLGGGLMLLLNWRASTAAWMLIVFTALATLMYHMSWSGDGGQQQMTASLKNLAIIGGLLLFANCHCKGGSCHTGDEEPKTKEKTA